MNRSELNHSHSEDLFDPRAARPITVLGAGSVGSQAVLMLAHAGVTDITIYDPDDIRSHNLPMTLAFGIADLGRFKVDVLHERVLRDTGVLIKTHRQAYKDEPLKSAVLCCVDNMETRMAVWKNAEGNPNVGLLVDTRTHQRFVSVYAIRPDMPEDKAFYETRLYPTSATRMPMCGSHGIVFVASAAALLAVRALTAFWSGDILAMHESILFGDLGTRLDVIQRKE